MFLASAKKRLESVSAELATKKLRFHGDEDRFHIDRHGSGQKYGSRSFTSMQFCC